MLVRFIILCSFFISCGNDLSNIEFDMPVEMNATELEYYPARTNEYEFDNKVHYSVYIWQDEMLHYDTIFEKFGYYGNGPAWEELCNTIIKLECPEVFNEIELESEASAALITMNSPEVQKKIAEAIHKWATDKEKLRKAFSKVNWLYMH